MTTKTEITREEYKRRYMQRIVDMIEDSPDLKPGAAPGIAEDCWNACTFEEISDGFEDDPEGAADMEMSYWEG